MASGTVHISNRTSDFIHFDCMMVGARKAGLSISETADLLNFFYTQQSLEFA